MKTNKAKLEERITRWYDQIVVFAPREPELEVVRTEGIRLIEDRLPNPSIRSVCNDEIPSIVEESDNPFIYGIMDERLGNDVNPEFVIEPLYIVGKRMYGTYPFGLPAACLIGEQGLSPQDYVKEKGRYFRPENKVDIDGTQGGIFPFWFSQVKYRFFWNILYNSTHIPTSVTAELGKMEGRIGIDIVKTGKTLEQNGLGVIALLKRYDGLLIGGEYAKELWRECKAEFSGGKRKQNVP